jgi:hypothetical protein
MTAASVGKSWALCRRVEGWVAFKRECKSKATNEQGLWAYQQQPPCTASTRCLRRGTPRGRPQRNLPLCKGGGLISMG